MSTIAFISPDKHLYLQGKKIIHDLGLDATVSLHLARLGRAVRLARRMQNEDVDVIVCRGGTAQLIINSRARIPVVEIPITGQDLAQVFHDAKRISGSERPKVAMLAFSNMIYDIEVLSTILGIELSIFNLEKVEDIPSRIAEVAQVGVDIVVGGIKTVMLAEKAGLKGGDIIVEFAGQKIANIYDYTYALDAAKIGQPVKIVVKRGDQRVEVTVTPEARK